MTDDMNKTAPDCAAHAAKLARENERLRELHSPANGDPKLIEAQDAEVKKRWPHLPTSTAKQRKRARQRLMHVLKCEELKAKGASCKNCLMRTLAPVYMSFPYACNYHSGGGAYVAAPDDHLCTMWRPLFPDPQP